jgi:hypothetical protein
LNSNAYFQDCPTENPRIVHRGKWIMSEAETPDLDERCPIWARYTNEPTDRKREQIERVLMNAGARFAVHDIATQHPEPPPQRLPDGLSVAFGGVDWNEDDNGIWIEARIPAQNVERTVSELRACGCIAGVGEADRNLQT